MQGSSGDVGALPECVSREHASHESPTRPAPEAVGERHPTRAQDKDHRSAGSPWMPWTEAGCGGDQQGDEEDLPD